MDRLQRERKGSIDSIPLAMARVEFQIAAKAVADELVEAGFH